VWPQWAGGGAIDDLVAPAAQGWSGTGAEKLRRGARELGVAGRRKEYRTWEELSGSERRRGVVILGGAGVVAVGAVIWVLGPTDGGSPAGAPPPVLAAGNAPRDAGSPPAVAATSPQVATVDLTGWYSSIAGSRGDITAAEASVRKAIADLDGVALQPACVLLDSRAVSAQSAGDVPDGDAGQAWSKGLTDYQQAAHWCAQLFDGTPIAPETLRANTTAALDAADTAWTAMGEATAAPGGATQTGAIAAGAAPAHLAAASPAG
jgi:hypothetical protein